VIHERKRLSFDLESRDHLPRVHPGLNYFQRHISPNGLELFGQKHSSKATFSQLPYQFVTTHYVPGFFANVFLRSGHDRHVQEVAAEFVSF
jgi:hypothetical protein